MDSVVVLHVLSPDTRADVAAWLFFIVPALAMVAGVVWVRRNWRGE
jgi:hypothetical protein